MVTDSDRFFHMSSAVYPVGKEIRGNGRDKVDPEIEKELEARRPSAAIARLDAVFGLEHTDFSVCGVIAPGYIYRIEPNEAPQRLDFAWIGEMQKELLKIRYPQYEEIRKYRDWNVDLIEKCCASYWSGAPAQVPGWEFLMESCTVVEVVSGELVDPKSTNGAWQP